MTTNAERLARIETLLERLPPIEAKLQTIEKSLEAEKARLSKLQDRGVGLLIGVGLGGGAAGAGLTRLLERLFH